MRTRLFAPAVAAAALLAAAPASALDIGGLDLRIGARGGAGMIMMNEPDDASLYGSTAYPGFRGVAWQFGAALNFRLFGFLGVEAGWLRSLDTVSGSVELKDVRRCIDAAGNGPCQRQELDLVFERTSDHIPLTLQLALPTGVARPFLNVGLDLVVNQSRREFGAQARDPFPEDLDPADPIEATMIEQWEASRIAQNALQSRIYAEGNEAYTGIIAGLGVEIRVKSVAIPIEFRANIYPSAGATMPQRGEFGVPCAAEQCVVNAETAPQYNDRWPMQFMILFGVDYRIF